MQPARILAIIPARLGSERLPRKPLHRIAGRPLIEWVWRRVSSFGMLRRVVIATDAEEIRAACESFGAEVALTSPHHASGTERIAELVERETYGDYDVIVNVQGDEPFVTEEQVSAAVAQLSAGFDIGTVAAPLATVAAWQDPSVVKVTRRADGAALYFSRSPIPHVRGREPTLEELSCGSFLRHVGVYACSPRVVRRWVALAPTALEALERLEQLRALTHGLTIGVGVVGGAEGGVDTPADAATAERKILAGHHS